jgi:hypothetical protein
VLAAGGRVGLVQPLGQVTAVLAGVLGQGGEEPVPAGHVGQPRGAFQAELPVGAADDRSADRGPDCGRT